MTVSDSEGCAPDRRTRSLHLLDPKYVSRHTTYTYVRAAQPAAPVLLAAQAAGQALTVTTDSAGLVTSVASTLGTTWSYRYDTEGRMVSACRAASCSGTGFERVDYGFDGAGHRTRITTTTAAGAVTTLDIAYAGDTPAQEKTNGTVSRTYVADEAGRIVRFCDPDCTGSSPVYLVAYNAHGDALSIGRLDPATGGVEVANRFGYATWGTPATTTANGHPDLGFRYLWVGAAGVTWDNSIGQALYDMHARTYSPVLGRFLQPDPARADGNLYAYAGNSPVTKSDPTGEFAIVFVGVVWGAIVILGLAALYHPTTGYGSHPLRAPSGSLRLPCIGSCGQPTGTVVHSAPPGTRLVTSNCAMSLSGCSGIVLSRRSTPQQDQKLTPGDIETLKKAGIDPEALKDHNGSNDLFKKPNGDVVIKPRSGQGPGDETDVNLRRLRRSGR